MFLHINKNQSKTRTWLAAYIFATNLYGVLWKAKDIHIKLMRDDSILDFIIVMEAMWNISRSDKKNVEANCAFHRSFFYKRMQKDLKMFNKIAPKDEIY